MKALASMRFMGIQTRMAWQDFLTDEERQELEAAEADFAAAKKALDPVKARRDATRKKLKIRCDMRMHRAKGENGEG